MSSGSVLFGSVCSGIEAASVAWYPLGWRAAWLAEIESFPCSVLAHHYPDVPNLGDMTKIAAMVRAGAVAAPDVLVGGTPCQAFSVAGLRNSLADARGQLSLSFVDLANAIDTARLVRGEPAAVIVWENVPGVLSTKDNAFGCFLGALAGEDEPVIPAGKKWANAGCVFGPQRTVAWRVLDAQYFGVAQRRRRVFVVASARNGFDPTAVLFECDGVRRDIAPSRETKQGAAGDTASSIASGSFDGEAGCWWDGGQLTQTLDAVLSKGQCMPEKNRFPAVLVPKVDAIGFEPRYYLPDNKTGGVPNETAQLSATNAAKSGDAAPCVTYGFQPRIGRNGRGDMGDVCAALTSQAGETGKGDSAPCVAVAFCQNTRDEVRLMGGDGQIVGALSAQPGMKPTCYVAQCVTGDITHTLKAEGFDASEDGTGRGQPIVAAVGYDSQNCALTGSISGTMAGCNSGNRMPHAFVGMAVRRLTPRECERLQGFPDDYTLVPGKRKNIRPEKLDIDYLKYLARGGVMTFDQCMNVAADGPRYKSLGNSMCVNVMAWLGHRIDAALKNQLQGTQ